MIVMKPFRLFLALCAGAGMLAAESAVAKHAMVSPTTVFSGPGAAWPVIAQIPAGAHVNVINCYAGWRRGWCQVQYGKVKGFVKGDTLAPSGGKKVSIGSVVTKYAIHVRKGPGRNWPVAGIVNQGATVNKGSCVTSWAGHWCRVTSGGVSGYAPQWELKRAGAIFE
jgi:uncharacterized protein YraI